MKTQQSAKRLVTGIIIIIIGFLFLAHRMEMLPQEFSNIVFHWPMILIALGIINLFTDGSKVPAVILLGVGVFFTLSHNDIMPYEFNKIFWPLLIIIIGILVLFRGSMHHRLHNVRNNIKQESSEITDDTFDEIAIFGGGDKIYNIHNLKGGQITNVFGGSDLDLTQCTLAEEGAVIELFTVFGGSSLRVPSNWNVVVQATPIFGGIDDKRAPMPNDQLKQQKLFIKGVVVFGGCDIKRG